MPIKLLDSDFCNKFTQINNEQLFDRDGSPNINGLFSPDIFGKTSLEKTTKFGSIPLNDRFMHPVIFMQFKKAFRIAIKEISAKKPYIIQNGKIEILKTQTDSSFTGFKYLFNNLDKLSKTDSVTSNEFWEIAEIYKDSMFIQCIPVIPLAFRDYRNEYEFDLLNERYIEIIHLSNLISKNPDSINLFDRMVLALEELFIEIQAKLAKKTGLIRGNVLGKRVDFSARSVIVNDPNLQPGQLGVPYAILAKIFEPWVIRILINEYSQSIPDATSILNRINKGYNKEDDINYKNAIEAIDKASENRVVLAKRDPSLHRLSLEPFYVVPVKDKAIHLYPLSTGPFNADFDGDSVICNVKLKVIHSNGKIEYIYDNILKLSQNKKLFEYEYTKKHIDYFKPNLNIYITSINIDTKTISENKITEYTMHRNLNLFAIKDTKKRFDKFWCSSDHSLIVLNKENNSLEKISPVTITQNPSNYCLVQMDKYIECSDIEIYIEPNINTAADFTVENDYTFCTKDGVFVQDTMTIFTPLSEEALQDAKSMTNPYSSANPRYVKYSFSKEYSFATCILLSRLIGNYAKLEDYDIDSKTIHTTIGRIKLIECLDKSNVNEKTVKIITEQDNIDDIILLLIPTIGVNQVEKFIGSVQKLCDIVMTEESVALTMKDLQLSDELALLRNKFEKEPDIEKKDQIMNQITAEVKHLALTNENLKLLTLCKSFKMNQLVQLLGIKGLVLSPSNNIESINGNFSEGLSKKEYFVSGHGARQGITSRTNKTRNTGYLSRKLMYALVSVELSPTIENCGTDKLLVIKSNKDLIERLLNRYIEVDGKLVLITPDNIKDYQDKTIKLRTPAFCKSKKICHTCYGLDYKLYNNYEIGSIAAQTLSERITQETLKVFHLGGVVSLTVNDIYKDLIDNSTQEKSFWDKYLEYKDNNLYAKQDLSLILDKEYFNINAAEMDSNEIELSMLISELETNENKYSFSINTPVILYTTSYESYKKLYKIHYTEGDIICKSVPITDDIDTKANRIISATQGKFKYKDITHAFMHIYKNFRNLGNITSVHIEVLLSQLLRCKENPQYPARLCTSDEFEIVSVKEIPFLESSFRALEFENFNKGLTNAILHPERVGTTKLDELFYSSQSKEIFEGDY